LKPGTHWNSQQQKKNLMKTTYIILGIAAVIVLVAVIYNALKNRRTSGSVTTAKDGQTSAGTAAPCPPGMKQVSGIAGFTCVPA
jgi:heme/copper-type cytochrome/quinol oxidase subunit 2